MHRFLILACVLIPALCGETFDEQHSRDIASNPPDLQFRLSTANGQYRIGERIPIRLEFSSTSPDKYKLNAATYDRGGRLYCEEFVTEQKDVKDPYADYFGLGVLGGIGGGLRSYPVLTPEPVGIDLDLNDWFRFDVPGQYRLYLKSDRLTRERLPGEAGEDKTVSFAAVSNVVEIEILPSDAAWEPTKLNEIRAILSHPEPELPKPGKPVPYDPFEQKMRIARRELHILATPAAVRLMLDDTRRTRNGPDTLALFGARDRPDAVAALDQYLADPSVGFRQWDIAVRAAFTYLAKDSPQPLTFVRWQRMTKSQIEEVQSKARSRQKRFEEIEREEAERLIPIVKLKDTGPRKIAAEAIAAIAPDAAKASGLVPPDDYGLSREQLIAQFLSFPIDQQQELLQKKWDLVRGPEMVPVLRKLIEKSQPDSPKETHWLNVWGVDTGVAFTALRRLNELSPDSVTNLLRNDIASAKPRFAGFAVRQLPAQDMPEADIALAAGLKSDFAVALPLTAKFGTTQLADQMRRLYAGTELWPCAEEQYFTTYFVRSVPTEGKQLLRRAMADRKQRGCYRMLLSQVASIVWNSVVESVAIDFLNDPDPEAVMSAAAALSGHGGPGVEPLLWNRLEQWSEKWRGRAPALESNPITERVPRPEAQLGSALFNAISSARSWILDDGRRERLRDLCIDERCHEMWARDQFSGIMKVDVANGGELYPVAFRVDGYRAGTLEELETKLAQFPRGSEFRWCPQIGSAFEGFTEGQLREMFDGLSAFLAKHSMTLETYSEEKCSGAVQ